MGAIPVEEYEQGTPGAVPVCIYPEGTNGAVPVFLTNPSPVDPGDPLIWYVTIDGDPISEPLRIEVPTRVFVSLGEGEFTLPNTYGVRFDPHGDIGFDEAEWKLGESGVVHYVMRNPDDDWIDVFPPDTIPAGSYMFVNLITG